jgi:sugar-specific transcriptional regulator TrmB
MNTKVLEGMGLARNEVKVYTTLLRLGSASVGKITKDSGVHRRNVYDALERLSKKGLAGHITRNRVKFFQAASPHRLMDILMAQRLMLNEQEKRVKNILPELDKIHASRAKEDVSIFWGKVGIVTILEDIIKTGKENLVLGAYVPKKLLPVIESYHRKRQRAKVPLKMIFNKADKARAARLARKPYTEVRLMPRAYMSPITINIYGDKVGLLIWSEERPMGILMKNNNVYVGFREFFNMLWDTATAS